MSTAIPEAFTADQVEQQAAAEAQAARQQAAAEAVAPASPPSAKMFTEAEVEGFRQQEKDKLYSRMDSLEKQLAEEAEAREQARLASEQAALKRQTAEEEAVRRVEEEELSAKELVERRDTEFRRLLDEKEQSWKQELDQERQRREATEALMEREREFAELRDYTQATVAANQEKIAPQLLSWIKGNSREEIDEAVARAVATTDSLTQDLQRVAQEQRQSLPGTRPTSGPADLDPSAATQTLSAEQIANMSMSEYAKIRSRLPVGGASQQNKGMYG